MSETPKLRITIMTFDEAYERYMKWMNGRPMAECWPTFTFSGWLHHKGIVVRDEEESKCL
jgi:hypothetical protein